MYGTIARLELKPGMEDAFNQFGEEVNRRTPEGAVASYVYRIDAEPNVLYLVAVFTSKEAYLANAGSPEQHAQFEKLRALLAADPEWHDGTVIYSQAAQA
jgi:quinol monooxygenase YgiN